MKVGIADATGCPVPQFIIYPETLEERLLLKAFCQFPRQAKEEWKFTLHGEVYQDGNVTSFNFGWAKTDH